MKIKRFEFARLANYLLLGGLGASIDTIVFVILDQVRIHLLIANTISTFLGIGVSYVLNSKYTFTQNQYSVLTAYKFFVVGLVGLILSNILLWVEIEMLGINPILAKIITLPPIALIQFTLNTIWTFNARSIQKEYN